MLKQPRVKDPKWLAFAQEMSCVFCDADDGTVVMHHIRADCHDCGMSMKPPDDRVVPTCSDCHSEIERIGEKPFYKDNGFTVKELVHIASLMYKRYKENEEKCK